MGNYLIMGASGGIGRSLALRLSRQHQVYGTYRNHPFEADTNLHPFHWEAGTEPAWTQLPEVLDGVVYCPGSIALRPFARFSEQDFLDDYRLQVTGAVKVLQGAYPRLKKAASPAVLLFSTVAVQTGMPFHSLVAASKGAVEGLTRSLAAEWAPSIRVNALAPSLTDTPLAASLLSSPEKREAAAKRHPLRRVGEPDDLAALAEFILSPSASWITGQVIACNGGLGSVITT
jgi:NAD(P)-dependent dehydrogenase (short-subunit alcohol dehydrogenase family)